MKVLIVNTQTSGGAAHSCLRLWKGLQQRVGKATDILLLKTNDNETFQSKLWRVGDTSSRFIKKWCNIFDKLGDHISNWRGRLLNVPGPFESKFIRRERQSKGLDYFSSIITRFDITKSKSYHNADIINLHWVADFLDYPSFFKKNKKPVVWTLHDMAPFLGGEHYAEWYDGITDDGSPIDRIWSVSELGVDGNVLKLKRNLFAKVHSLHIVCPSIWLKEEAQKSGLFPLARFHHIPYGLDTKLFKPLGRKHLRNKYNLDSESFVLLFVADSVQSQRKGLKLLLKALQYISVPVVLVTVGSGDLLFHVPDSVSHKPFGRVNGEHNMAEIYNAADFMVIPSLMDNLPNTVLESLCCGTPVIGFPVGGIPEMVDEDNGVLAQRISAFSLANAIEFAIDKRFSFDRIAISDRARQKYSLDVQAERYLKLFRKIMEA